MSIQGSRARLKVPCTGPNQVTFLWDFLIFGNSWKKNLPSRHVNAFHYCAGSKAPQKVQFVDQMTRILSDHLPDLWRLGQAYFSGKLHKDVRIRKCITFLPQPLSSTFDVVTLMVFDLLLQVKDKASKINISKQKHFKVRGIEKWFQTPQQQVEG